MVSTSLRRTLTILTEVARREEIDLDDITNDADAGTIEDDPERHTRDPLAAGARQYAELAWRITQALEPVVAQRGDRGRHRGGRHHRLVLDADQRKDPPRHLRSVRRVGGS